MTNIEWIKTLSAKELADWFYDEWLNKLQYTWNNSKGGLVYWLNQDREQDREKVDSEAKFKNA